MFKFKWLSPDGDGTGGAASGTPVPQSNAGGRRWAGRTRSAHQRAFGRDTSWRNKHKQAAEEASKAKADLDAANSKLTASEVQHGVEKSADPSGIAEFVNPDDVLKFVDVATIAQLSPDKRAAAIAEALDKLAADKPHFVQSAAARDGREEAGCFPREPSRGEDHPDARRDQGYIAGATHGAKRRSVPRPKRQIRRD